MANSPQARKRARQAETTRQHNAGMRTRIRTYLKRVNAAVEAKDAEAAVAAFKVAEPILDRYVNKKLIHKNTAARQKSRLTAKINKLTTA